MAFFRAPGMDRLYSGVTKRTASTAAIDSFSESAGPVGRPLEHRAAPGRDRSAPQPRPRARLHRRHEMGRPADGPDRPSWLESTDGADAQVGWCQ